MKMHDREWYALACRPRSGGSAARSNLPFIREITEGMPVSWAQASGQDGPVVVQAFEIISARRYFLMTNPDVDLEQMLSKEGMPRLIRTRREIRFGYRGYAASVD